MIIGILKEIKNEEYRVGATPMAADALISAGRQVLVESKAGLGSGFGDAEYREAGATVVNYVDEIWRRVQLILI